MEILVYMAYLMRMTLRSEVLLMDVCNALREAGKIRLIPF